MSTLNILLTTGKLYTKIITGTNHHHWETLVLIVKESINVADIQSIWVQPNPIQITLEDLEL